MKTLGECCLEWMVKYLGVKEQPPGSNSGPFIDGWLDKCIRRDTEQALHLKKSNWCSSFVSASLYAVLAPGEVPPHGYRAGVVELVADALEGLPRFSGVYVPSKKLLDGVWTPMPGDLVIYDRSDPSKPETSWYRHVNRILRVVSSTKFECIGGNQNDEVSIVLTQADSPKVLGYIQYPRPVVSTTFTEDERKEILNQVGLCLDGMTREISG